jgi:hypothetical protein
MNFEEFKKRYEDKLIGLGMDRSQLPSDERIGEIFTALAVLTEWQKEESEKQWKAARQKALKDQVDGGFFQ